MSLSKAFMNSGTFSSLSAAAMAVNTSMMSEWVSARRHATATKVSRALGTIARINLNVLFREVARPEARARHAAAMQDESYQALLCVQLFLEVRFGEIRGNRKSTRLNSSHPSISYAVF